MEFDLELRRRSEGGRAALGGRRVVPRAVPPERRLSEPGPCRDYRARSNGIGGAFVQDCKVAVAEHEDAPRARLDVVHERHLAQAELPFQLRRVDVPGKVDPRYAPPDDHARDAERGALRSHAGRRKEGLEEVGQALELRGDVGRSRHRRGPLLREDPEARLGGADVAGEDHRPSSTSLLRRLW